MHTVTSRDGTSIAYDVYGTSGTPIILVDATTLCAATIPGARHVVLPGQTHEVKGAAIAPSLFEVFGAAAARAAA